MPQPHRFWSLSLSIALLAALPAACSSSSDDDSSPDDSSDDNQPDDGSDGGGPDAQGGVDSGGVVDGSTVDGSGGDVDGSLVLADAEPQPDAPPPLAEGPYDFLSQSGLYSNIATHTIAADVIAFEPEFKLWSDGAEKERWIRLPPDTQIDTSDMDRWVMPIGATAWKEFSDPVSGKRLETRIIQRLSNGNYYFASFLWNETETDAIFDPTLYPQPAVDIPDGCSECDSPPCAAYPTSCHVVPQSNECNKCHGGEASKLLGFSAVQLSHGGPGLTLTDLVDLGVLSDPPSSGVTFPVPGTPVERAAIGYLHANCGHCHSPVANQGGCYAATTPGGPGMQARVLSIDATVQDTQIYQSAVDQPLRYWMGPMQGNYTEEQFGELITDRIVPGDPSRSAVHYRMSVREWGELEPFNDHQQMPFFATNEVDEDGLAAVDLWINSLP